MITKVTQTCITLWFIFFVPPVSHESMRMAWLLFGPKCRVWCLFGGAQSIKHKPPVKTQDLCKFSTGTSPKSHHWVPQKLKPKSHAESIIIISSSFSSFPSFSGHLPTIFPRFPRFSSDFPRSPGQRTSRWATSPGSRRCPWPCRYVGPGEFRGV